MEKDTRLTVVVINDNSSVLQVLEALVEAARETPVAILQKPDGYYIGSKLVDPLDEIAKANVVLLDHHMPQETGEELFKRWSVSGTNQIRIIGTSNEAQTYLAEHVSALEIAKLGVEGLKALLNKTP